MDLKLKPNMEEEREFTRESRLVVLGGFFGWFVSAGLIGTQGVFTAYYKHHQLSNQSQFAISWLPAICTAFDYCGPLVVGPIIDRYGGKFMLYFGSVLIVFTLMMASLCKEYYQFILAQGVLLGISLAIVFTTSTIYVGLWFNKKRGTAIGLIAPGGPLAGIILPIAISQMLSHTNLGFGWTMRMVGFICIPPLAIACALIRPPPSMDARISSREPESGMNQEVPKEASTEQHEELNNTPVATQRQTVWAVMKKPALFLTCLALFVTYFAINVPLFFVSSYTLSKGFSSGLAFYSVSLVNAGSLCGRFLMGVLSDRYGKFNCITLVAAAGGIISLFWTLVNGIPGLVIFSFCYGFCEGGIISLQQSCAAQIAPPEVRGLTIGLIMASTAVSVLAGIPIGGALSDNYGYLALSIYTGVGLLIGSSILAFARIVQDRRLFAVV